MLVILTKFAENIGFSMAENNKYLNSLKADVEDRIGRGILSPTDFEFLHLTIERELNEHVSVSTLKRLWGYSKYLSSPSVSILSTLSRLVGHRDWDDYKANRESSDKKPSAQVLSD